MARATWIGPAGERDSTGLLGHLRPGIDERDVELDSVNWAGPLPLTATAAELVTRGTRSPWGVSAATGRPYYDTQGATPGEEHRLFLETGRWWLEDMT